VPTNFRGGSLRCFSRIENPGRAGAESSQFANRTLGMSKQDVIQKTIDIQLAKV
jgi:hypothetical protein